MSYELPLPLQNAIQTGNCVLFLGAGIGYDARDSEGKPAPDAAALAGSLADHFGIAVAGTPDLAKVAQVVELRKGRPELQAYLTKKLATLEPDEHLVWLLTLPWRAIFTTNYDNLIGRSYELQRTPRQLPVIISCAAEAVTFDPRFEVPVYHIHGALFGVEVPHCLITERDYSTYREQRRMLFELLKAEFATSTILYVGYSHNDSTWKKLRSEIEEEFHPRPLPRSYRLAPTTDPLDLEILRAQGVDTIEARLDEFRAVAEPAFDPNGFEPDRLRALKGTVPAALMKAFDANPAPTIRLLNSWIYVNGAPFDEQTSIKSYLSGERPTLALIARKLTFARDVEEPLFDDLLDFATMERPGRTVLLLLGAAGYGVTTVLMSTAVRLAEEKVGHVFMHKVDAPMLASDIEYAATLVPAPIFFVIDNAADATVEVKASIARLRDDKVPACFLLGERSNEWRQRGARLQAREHALEALSENEIRRLVEYLAQHSALHTLEGLSVDQQMAAIREKHEKQLLVAMKEATEGKAFDAIIEDEYRNIAGDLARRLYVVVCSAYHLRKSVRDSVLADVLRVDHGTLHQDTAIGTEGIVTFTVVDEARGIVAARARHQVIAQVIWDRCATTLERDDTIQKVLDALNMSYGIDAALFEEFVRSDKQVDSISTLEGRMRFFETACRKSPESPYVRQHYARMLLREEKPELALAEIDKALEMAPEARVLHHTKGKVLEALSSEAASVEVARRRMIQSEASYRRSVNMQPKDSYGYQGLGDLYLAWAERSGDPEEVASYIQKAEEVIGEGLVKAKDREGLYVLSSKVQRVVGDKPAALEALKRAVSASPKGIIGRYVLGRVHRKAGRCKEAIDVLEPVLRNHPDEFRSAIELAQALVDAGESYKKAIAVLRLANTSGLRDARYVATLGGMLVLNDELSEAERVFSDSNSRNSFTLDELSRASYRPDAPGHFGVPLRVLGTVVSVKGGYAFVEADGYPRYFLPGSRFGRLRIGRSERLSFRVAFTARGPVVEEPTQGPPSA